MLQPIISNSSHKLHKNIEITHAIQNEVIFIKINQNFYMNCRRTLKYIHIEVADSSLKNIKWQEYEFDLLTLCVIKSLN